MHEAGLRGLRLLLVLTNGGSSQGGGMKQYVDWVDPALTVTAFYTNDTIKVGEVCWRMASTGYIAKRCVLHSHTRVALLLVLPLLLLVLPTLPQSVFLDYVAGLLDHTSSLSGLPLRWARVC